MFFLHLIRFISVVIKNKLYQFQDMFRLMFYSKTFFPKIISWNELLISCSLHSETELVLWSCLYSNDLINCRHLSLKASSGVKLLLMCWYFWVYNRYILEKMAQFLLKLRKNRLHTSFPIHFFTHWWNTCKLFIWNSLIQLICIQML